uniref:F-box protein PP2-B2 n=1 Tax=Elaeis guineensis var. tenera TaxID=51953 RepID=A0A8N4I6X4_ELAGV
MASRQEESEGGEEICRLPEGCISHVLSFTMPRDSCRSALVSATFRSAAFLPSDYQSILSQAVDPVRYSSKRDLYFRLCDSIIIGMLPSLLDAALSFGLERSTGHKCSMISPRSMHIIGGDDKRYWRWISLPEP